MNIMKTYEQNIRNTYDHTYAHTCEHIHMNNTCEHTMKHVCTIHVHINSREVAATCSDTLVDKRV